MEAVPNFITNIGFVTARWICRQNIENASFFHYLHFI